MQLTRRAMKFFLKSKRAKVDQRPDKFSILWTFAGAPPFGRFCPCAMPFCDAAH
jgi:hypothetical protein